MGKISLLKNIIQHYSWGSHTAISNLLGTLSPSPEPYAELWMGTHPKAPSLVMNNNYWIPLINLIKENPISFLGENTFKKFNANLPYLFKVLAAVKPLSIQAHPSIIQAKNGFDKENKAKIPFDSPIRNYKDENHKPELICAIKPFTALNGFRKFNEMLSLMERISPLFFKDNIKDFFSYIMKLDTEERNKLINSAIDKAKNFINEDKAFEWMIKLHDEYPNDIGIFSPILLNLVNLSPGQAMFIQSGELHAYLDGVGIELMANSDNVLRGGLTPKHVDIKELLSILTFKEKKVDILNPLKKNECESVYLSSADEFCLSIIEIKSDDKYISPFNRSAEIILCTQGDAIITDIEKNETIEFNKGSSLIIPASVKNYQIKGCANIYKAFCPLDFL